MSFRESAWETTTVHGCLYPLARVYWHASLFPFNTNVHDGETSLYIRSIKYIYICEKEMVYSFLFVKHKADIWRRQKKKKDHVDYVNACDELSVLTSWDLRANSVCFSSLLPPLIQFLALTPTHQHSAQKSISVAKATKCFVLFLSAPSCCFRRWKEEEGKGQTYRRVLLFSFSFYSVLHLVLFVSFPGWQSFIHFDQSVDLRTILNSYTYVLQYPVGERYVIVIVVLLRWNVSTLMTGHSHEVRVRKVPRVLSVEQH